jgi:hypothetical protein
MIPCSQVDRWFADRLVGVLRGWGRSRRLAATNHGESWVCDLIFGNLVIAKRGNHVACVCAQRRVALRNLANASCLRESFAVGRTHVRLIVEQTPKGESFCS